MDDDDTRDGKSTLTAICADILARPDFYAEGAAFLADRYGPDRLHQEALADWQKWKDQPLQKASHRECADRMTKGIADRAKRKARRAEILENLSAPPDRGRWTPAACAFHAIMGIMNLPADTHKDIRAKATCILAVLLWDENADKRHPIFRIFGPWGRTPAGEVESVARWTATHVFDYRTFKKRRWMNRVKEAWAALSLSNGTTGRPVPVDRIQQLPIPLEFPGPLMETARYVLGHSAAFINAANSINAELAEKVKLDGYAKRPVYWLSEMLPDAAREAAPALAEAEYELWAHRLMLLATIASYPGELAHFGVCGAIPWDLRTLNATISSSDNTPVALPVLGRAWILFELDGSLRPEMLDKSGESMPERATRVVDGKAVDREFKREPWRVRGVLGLLLDRLKPILAELPRAKTGAGAAFAAAMDSDPKAKAAWERAREKLQAYAKGLKAADAGIADDLRRRLETMAEAIREGLRASGEELAAQGFIPPATVEDWEHLARIVEIPFETILSGNLTSREIHACALAWADRQRIKAKLTTSANAPTQSPAPGAMPPATVNKADSRLRIPSCKTEHHAGGAERTIPLFSEIESVLLKLYDPLATGNGYVITRYRETRQNLRTQLCRIIKRAGLETWERPWHNMRATRETELAESFPIQVVCAWIGNSARVAQAHYLQVTDAHYQKAVGEAAQNPAQQMHADARKSRQDEGENHFFPHAAATCDSMRDDQRSRQESNL